MSGIAEVLLNLGYAVSRLRPEALGHPERLGSLGARVRGHQAEHVAGAARGRDLLRGEARTTPRWWRRGRTASPVIPRAEMLAELMRLKYGVAVAGSHGKTTTTSMVATSSTAAGSIPRWWWAAAWACWARRAPGQGRLHGGGGGRVRPLLPEADAHRRRGHQHRPRAPRHLPGPADIQEAFVGFVNKVPFYGAAVLCLDDPPVQDIAARVEGAPTAPKGGPAWRNLGSQLRWRCKGGELGRLELNIPGTHNV